MNVEIVNDNADVDPDDDLKILRRVVHHIDPEDEETRSSTRILFEKESKDVLKMINDSKPIVGSFDINLDDGQQAVAFIGGSEAVYLEKKGKTALAAYALECVEQAFGSDIKKKLMVIFALLGQGTV